MEGPNAPDGMTDMEWLEREQEKEMIELAMERSLNEFQAFQTSHSALGTSPERQLSHNSMPAMHHSYNEHYGGRRDREMSNHNHRSSTGSHHSFHYNHRPHERDRIGSRRATYGINRQDAYSSNRYGGGRRENSMRSLSSTGTPVMQRPLAPLEYPGGTLREVQEVTEAVIDSPRANYDRMSASVPAELYHDRRHISAPLHQYDYRGSPPSDGQYAMGRQSPPNHDEYGRRVLAPQQQQYHDRGADQYHDRETERMPPNMRTPRHEARAAVVDTARQHLSEEEAELVEQALSLAIRSQHRSNGRESRQQVHSEETQRSHGSSGSSHLSADGGQHRSPEEQRKLDEARYASQGDNGVPSHSQARPRRPSRNAQETMNLLHRAAASEHLSQEEMDQIEQALVHNDNDNDAEEHHHSDNRQFHHSQPQQQHHQPHHHQQHASPGPPTQEHHHPREVHPPAHQFDRQDGHQHEHPPSHQFDRQDEHEHVHPPSHQFDRQDEHARDRQYQPQQDRQHPQEPHRDRQHQPERQHDHHTEQDRPQRQPPKPREPPIPQRPGYRPNPRFAATTSRPQRSYSGDSVAMAKKEIQRAVEANTLSKEEYNEIMMALEVSANAKNKRRTEDDNNENNDSTSDRNNDEVSPKQRVGKNRAAKDDDLPDLMPLPDKQRTLERSASADSISDRHSQHSRTISQKSEDDEGSSRALVVDDAAVNYMCQPFPDNNERSEGNVSGDEKEGTTREQTQQEPSDISESSGQIEEDPPKAEDSAAEEEGRTVEGRNAISKPQSHLQGSHEASPGQGEWEEAQQESEAKTTTAEDANGQTREVDQEPRKEISAVSSSDGDSADERNSDDQAEEPSSRNSKKDPDASRPPADPNTRLGSSHHSKKSRRSNPAKLSAALAALPYARPQTQGAPGSVSCDMEYSISQFGDSVGTFGSGSDNAGQHRGEGSVGSVVSAETDVSGPFSPPSVSSQTVRGVSLLPPPLEDEGEEDVLGGVLRPGSPSADSEIKASLTGTDSGESHGRAAERSRTNHDMSESQADQRETALRHAELIETQRGANKGPLQGGPPQNEGLLGQFDMSQASDDSDDNNLYFEEKSKSSEGNAAQRQWEETIGGAQVGESNQRDNVVPGGGGPPDDSEQPTTDNQKRLDLGPGHEELTNTLPALGGHHPRQPEWEEGHDNEPPSSELHRLPAKAEQQAIPSHEHPIEPRGSHEQVIPSREHGVEPHNSQEQATPGHEHRAEPHSSQEQIMSGRGHRVEPRVSQEQAVPDHEHHVEPRGLQEQITPGHQHRVEPRGLQEQVMPGPEHLVEPRGGQDIQDDHVHGQHRFSREAFNEGARGKYYAQQGPWTGQHRRDFRPEAKRFEGQQWQGDHGREHPKVNRDRNMHNPEQFFRQRQHSSGRRLGRSESDPYDRQRRHGGGLRPPRTQPEVERDVPQQVQVDPGDLREAWQANGRSSSVSSLGESTQYSIYSAHFRGTEDFDRFRNEDYERALYEHSNWRQSHPTPLPHSMREAPSHYNESEHTGSQRQQQSHHALGFHREPEYERERSRPPDPVNDHDRFDEDLKRALYESMQMQRNAQSQQGEAYAQDRSDRVDPHASRLTPQTLDHINRALAGSDDVRPSLDRYGATLDGAIPYASDRYAAAAAPLPMDRDLSDPTHNRHHGHQTEVAPQTDAISPHAQASRIADEVLDRALQEAKDDEEIQSLLLAHRLQATSRTDAIAARITDDALDRALQEAKDEEERQSLLLAHQLQQEDAQRASRVSRPSTSPRTNSRSPKPARVGAVGPSSPGRRRRPLETALALQAQGGSNRTPNPSQVPDGTRTHSPPVLGPRRSGQAAGLRALIPEDGQEVLEASFASLQHQQSRTNIVGAVRSSSPDRARHPLENSVSSSSQRRLVQLGAGHSSSPDGARHLEESLSPLPQSRNSMVGAVQSTSPVRVRHPLEDSYNSSPRRQDRSSGLRESLDDSLRQSSGRQILDESHSSIISSRGNNLQGHDHVRGSLEESYSSHVSANQLDNSQQDAHLTTPPPHDRTADFNGRMRQDYSPSDRNDMDGSAREQVVDRQQQVTAPASSQSQRRVAKDSTPSSPVSPAPTAGKKVKEGKRDSKRASFSLFGKKGVSSRLMQTLKLGSTRTMSGSQSLSSASFPGNMPPPPPIQQLDPDTRLQVDRAIEKGLISSLGGVVKLGREATIFHAEKGPESNGFDVAVKVYKRAQGDQTATSKEQLEMWTLKEFRNLKRVRRAGVPSPAPFLTKNNTLFMQFMGKGGHPAPQLGELDLRRGHKRWKPLYKQIVEALQRLFVSAELVHGGLNETNILVVPRFFMDPTIRSDTKEYDTDTAVLIDFGQTVDSKHPDAMDLLRRDVQNVRHFFVKQGIRTQSVDDAMKYITSGPKSGDEPVEESPGIAS